MSLEQRLAKLETELARVIARVQHHDGQTKPAEISRARITQSVIEKLRRRAKS